MTRPDRKTEPGMHRRRLDSSGCLRETRVPIGLLCNAKQIRIGLCPHAAKTSGFATFGVSEMAQVAGRPIFAALHMLLCEERLFSLGEKQRLPAILADSRKYQNVVSSQLAEQVLRCAVRTRCLGDSRRLTTKPRENCWAKCSPKIPTTSTRACSHRPDAARLRVVRRRPRIVVQRSDLRELLLDHRAIREVAGRRWPVSRHDGSTLRGLGTVSHVVPA